MKHVEDALRKKYEKDGYIFLTEFAFGQRRIDGIAVSPWTARDYGMYLFEFKRERSDWLRELHNPAKQESFYTFGGGYYFVACNDGEDNDVIHSDEVPNGFGLMTWNGTHLKIHKEPTYRKPAYTTDFLMYFLNKVRGYYNEDAITDAYYRGREETENRYKKEVRDLRKRVEELFEREHIFHEKTGIYEWQCGNSIEGMADAFNAFKKASDSNFADMIKDLDNDILALRKYKSELQGYVRKKQGLP